MTGGGGGGYAGGPPGYVGGGGGGGGFFSNFLGGMFGSMAGSWMYNSFFGGGSQEAIGTLELEGGRACEILVEYAARTIGPLGIKALHVGALRPLGGAPRGGTGLSSSVSS